MSRAAQAGAEHESHDRSVALLVLALLPAISEILKDTHRLVAGPEGLLIACSHCLHPAVLITAIASLICSLIYNPSTLSFFLGVQILADRARVSEHNQTLSSL